jgi:hypothetical protein
MEFAVFAAAPLVYSLQFSRLRRWFAVYSFRGCAASLQFTVFAAAPLVCSS